LPFSQNDVLNKPQRMMKHKQRFTNHTSK